MTAPTAALSAPGSKSGRLQRAVLALLREHERSSALPTSGRFIWYELAQRGIVDKTRACGHPGVRRGIDQDVSDALTASARRGSSCGPGSSMRPAPWTCQDGERAASAIDDRLPYEAPVGVVL